MTIDQPLITDIEGTRKRLTFFKVMAFLVGVGLLVLVAEIILKYGFNNDALAWWPQPHGFLFMVYIVAVAVLGFKVGWTLPKMILIMLSGMVPFVSFWVERRVSREVEAQLVASGPARRAVG